MVRPTCLTDRARDRPIRFEMRHETSLVLWKDKMRVMKQRCRRELVLNFRARGRWSSRVSGTYLIRLGRYGYAMNSCRSYSGRDTPWWVLAVPRTSGGAVVLGTDTGSSIVMPIQPTASVSWRGTFLVVNLRATVSRSRSLRFHPLPFFNTTYHEIIEA